jgi:hypothetical protein
MSALAKGIGERRLIFSGIKVCCSFLVLFRHSWIAQRYQRLMCKGFVGIAIVGGLFSSDS